MTKPSITKRSVKGAALTYNELDANFQNLKDATVALTAGTGGTQVTSDLNGNITLVAGTNITLSGDNTAKTITINTTSAATGLQNVVEDTTPQLGGDLDVNGKIITSTANGNIELNPDGTGQVRLVANNVLVGSGGSVTIDTNSGGALFLRDPINDDSAIGIGSTGVTIFGDGLSILGDTLTMSGGGGSMNYITTDGDSLYLKVNGQTGSAGILISGGTNGSVTMVALGTGKIYTNSELAANDKISIIGTASVTSNSATTHCLNVGTRGQLFDDGNLHIHASSGALWINSLDSGNIKIGTQYNTGSGSDVDIGKNLIVNSGSVTANATAAFIAGSNAISNVSLQVPSESAVRNTTNGSTNMYFDVSTGGSTTGAFQFRSGSGYTNFMQLDSSGPKAITAYKGKLGWNSAIDTELTVDDYRFRVSNQGGVFPQIISNTGGTKNTAWTAVGAISGAAIAQVGSTGVFVANNAWTTLYNSHGMDSAGDTVTVTLQDKAQGRIYRITFMRSDNGTSTGYNIIVERIL